MPSVTYSCDGCDVPVEAGDLPSGEALRQGDHVFCAECRGDVEELLDHSRKSLQKSAIFDHRCSGCRSQVPLADIAGDRVAWYRGQLYCVECRESAAFLPGRLAAGAVESGERVCPGCGCRIPDEQIAQGLTRERDGRIFCADCATELATMADETRRTKHDLPVLQAMPCHNCGVEVDALALVEERAITHEEDVYCLRCAGGLLGRLALGDEVASPGADQPAALVEERLCDGCERRLPRSQVESGVLLERGARLFCRSCSKAIEQLGQQTVRHGRSRLLQRVACAVCERTVRVTEQREGRAGHLEGSTYCPLCTDELAPILKRWLQRRARPGSSHYSCTGCDAEIAAGDVAAGQAVLFQGDYYCSSCRGEIDLIHQETRQATVERPAAQLTCDACEAQVAAGDLRSGAAHVYQGKIFCKGCRKESRAVLRQKLRMPRRALARSHALRGKVEMVVALGLIFMLVHYFQQRTAPAASAESVVGTSQGMSSGPETRPGTPPHSGVTGLGADASPAQIIAAARDQSGQGVPGRLAALARLQDLVRTLPPRSRQAREARDLLAEVRSALNRDAAIAWAETQRQVTERSAAGDWEGAQDALAQLPAGLRDRGGLAGQVRDLVLEIEERSRGDAAVGRSIKMARELLQDGERAAAASILAGTLQGRTPGSSPRMVEAQRLLQKIEGVAGDPSPDAASAPGSSTATPTGTGVAAGLWPAPGPAAASLSKAILDAHRAASEALAAGRLAEARDGFSAVASKAPSLAAAWIGLAASQRRLGDYRSALVAAEQSVRLAPERADSQWERAQLYHRFGRYGETTAALALVGTRVPEAPRLAAVIRGPFASRFPYAAPMLEGRSENGAFFLVSDLEYTTDFLVKANWLVGRLRADPVGNAGVIERLLAPTRSFDEMQQLLDSMLAACDELLPSRGSEALVFRVFVFSRAEDMATFSQAVLPGVQAELPHGFYDPTFHMICLTDPLGGQRRRLPALLSPPALEALLHACAHLHLQRLLGDVPAWLAEGFASWLEASRPVLGGRLKTGFVPEARPNRPDKVATLTTAMTAEVAADRPLGFRDLAQLDDQAFRADGREALRIAQAWSLVHFLSSSVEGQKRLRYYVRALRSGEDLATAWTTAFGDQDPLRFTARWRDHVLRLR